MNHVPHEHRTRLVLPIQGRLRVAIYMNTMLSQLRGLRLYPPFRPDLKLLMVLKHNFTYFYHIPYPLSSLFRLFFLLEKLALGPLSGILFIVGKHFI